LTFFLRHQTNLIKIGPLPTRAPKRAELLPLEKTAIFFFVLIVRSEGNPTVCPTKHHDIGSNLVDRNPERRIGHTVFVGFEIQPGSDSADSHRLGIGLVVLGP
jgi:hypothetical protein